MGSLESMPIIMAFLGYVEIDKSVTAGLAGLSFEDILSRLLSLSRGIFKT